MRKLPIDSLLPALKECLRNRKEALLTALPGSGKTTRVPLSLLEESWLAGRKILLLEPRRLAARSAACYMASLLAESAGGTVGYRIRLETKVSSKTRVEVITEGVLIRMLQSDPSLEGVGLVIFDEFHERSLQADLGLALVLESQAILRPDLRILVMSATMNVKPVAKLLNNAPILEGEGQAFPVETRWLGRPQGERLENAVARAAASAIEEGIGDVLVFLPGAAEIRRVEALLLSMGLGDTAFIAPLFGNLPQSAQDAAVLPDPSGKRKIVLATAIAETSLTIDGVQVVVDSGLMRVPRFNPRTGLTRLETVSVSQASANQRRGRAGRQGPGLCFRLWTQQEDARLEPFTKPEILEADLSPLALELAAWGTADPLELRWLDCPPAAAFSQARDLLVQLGAIAGTVITPHGRRLADSGIHPRLSHMISKAIELGFGSLACQIAVVLSERDILPASGGISGADLRLRLDLLNRSLSEGNIRRMLTEVRHLQQVFGIGDTRPENSEVCGLLLSFAYPERIALRRPDSRYLLANGRGAAFVGADTLANEPYLAIADLDDRSGESRIFLAAPLTLSELRQYAVDQIQRETLVAWDSSAKAVRARQITRLGAIMLQDAPVSQPDPDQIHSALLQGIGFEGLDILPWSRAASQLRQRMQFMHSVEADWPDVSDEWLTANLAVWLGSYLYGMKSAADLAQLNLVVILEARLTWSQRREIDEFAPTHLLVPSGQRIPVDYSTPASPVLAVRLQEMFGLADTPRIGHGRIPLTLHLLSPARRPVQVTKDLASFWRTAYFEVKKDLMGRYPKHYWPDDPLQAVPTHRVRPRN